MVVMLVLACISSIAMTETNSAFATILLDPPDSKLYYDDGITVDGYFDDWDGTDWRPFDRVYDGNPVDIADGSAWAAKWGAGGTKVYMAVKVKDTDHFFTNTYTEWDARDTVEMLMNTTGTDIGPYGTNNFPNYQEQAQEWTVGIKNSDRNSVWTALGHWPTNHYTPSQDEYMAKGHEDGEWLYYEAAIATLEYCGGIRGHANILSIHSEGDIIRTDAALVGHGANGYTGMKTSGHIGPGWYYQYWLLAQHELLRTGVKGIVTLLDYNAADKLGITGTATITDGATSETHKIVLGADGTYSFTTNLRGDCTVKVKIGHWLKNAASVAVDANGDAVADFSLINGDVNGDGQIGGTDLFQLRSNWGKTVAEASNPNADLNGDGTIGGSDLFIIRQSWGKTDQ